MPEISRGATVLVVDDEPQVVAVIRIMLVRAGYEVLTALDGNAALDVLSEATAPVDLVLSDVKMPGINGYQLIGRVRESYPGTRAMLMSGYVPDREMDGVLFLSKPFTREQLLAGIEATLAAGRAEAAPGVARHAGA